MLLSVPERILLLDVLPPAEGDYLFLRAVRTLRENLGFSEAEAADIGLKRDGNVVTWSQDQNPIKDIEIGPVMSAYISQSIVSAQHLREEHFGLYSRFVQESA